MRSHGFSLMELLIVLVLIGLLASLAAPVVTGSIQNARESALKESLHNMRKAIDDYYADTGNYPDVLDVLVQKRYLRKLPLDPITDRKDSWTFVREEREGQPAGGGIMDVRSGAEGAGSDGKPYKEW
jgi:general secretion pathway protein G